jgi:hypothetical protein
MSKLQPLDVPWQISPSTPHLGVRTKSFDGVNHGFVTFMGYLGEGTTLYRKHGTYRQIAVILESIVGVRMYPEYSPDDSERLDSYDWEAIPEFRDDDGSLRNHVKQFHEQWNTTDICPDPAAYLVEDSDWLFRLRFTPDAPPHLQFQHYLFVGSDYNVEVIAKSWKWEIVGSDTESPSVASSVESGIGRA